MYVCVCVVLRSGLIVLLSADLLLWLNAVTEDTIHLEMEMEKEDREEREAMGNNPLSLEAGTE